MNCWEYMLCGREEGGPRAEDLGVCPAALEKRADGLHRGKNGGRVCWAIAGTLCRGQVQGTSDSKIRDCAQCDFFHSVYQDEGKSFIDVAQIAYRVFHNCWEFMECGREPGGRKSHELGVCPSSTESRADGIHGGTNGGRACWAIAGTLCAGARQGVLASKFNNCLRCPFLAAIQSQEGENLKTPEEIQRLMAMKEPVTH